MSWLLTSLLFVYCVLSGTFDIDRLLQDDMNKLMHDGASDVYIFDSHACHGCYDAYCR